MAITMAQLASNLAKASSSVRPETAKQLAQVAQLGTGHVKRSIQDFNAVDTGAMLNSTTVDKTSENSYLVGPTVEYATYVALGTVHMPARPFHIKGAERLRKEIRDLNLEFIKLG